MAVQAAIAFHQEIIAGMCTGCKNMAQLLANDPPEAFAQVTAFIAECMAFTKTVGVATEVINALAPHLNAVESLYKGFIEKVQQSEAEGLSAGQAASNNTTKLVPQAESAASAKAIEAAEGVAAGGNLNVQKNCTLLPNVKNAKIDLRKLTEYALSKNHPIGKNKAKVFESALGFDESHAAQLVEQIISSLPTGTTILGQADQYGQRYTVDVLITGINAQTATVRTGWIIKTGSNIPELTTLFVK